MRDAVNAAFKAGGSTRRSIAVLPGTYRGTVFIPAGSPPLTVHGAGRPAEVRLEFTVDATLTPAAWAALVMRLISRQDTFMANANDVARIARVFVRDSYIEGDTDFVFGRASAVCTSTRFHLVSTRKDSGG